MYAGSVELIRFGSNAVFHVGPDVVGRVSPVESLENSIRQVKIARWLGSLEYPVNLALPVSQPVRLDDAVVTFWASIGDGTVYAPLADVAAVIKRLHELDGLPPGVELPKLRPLGATGDPLPEFRGIDREDAHFLRSRIEWVREDFPNLAFELPPGLIHGDANVGNVLSDKNGQPVVIDLDNFAVGPREWDLIQTALFYDRFGWHTREEYTTFVDVYGYDIMEWSGYSDLADMREILMTVWLSRKAEESSSTAAEASKRINAIRTGASRRDWGAY
jgi:hypothetical protein